MQIPALAASYLERLAVLAHFFWKKRRRVRCHSTIRSYVTSELDMSVGYAAAKGTNANTAQQPSISNPADRLAALVQTVWIEYTNILQQLAILWGKTVRNAVTDTKDFGTGMDFGLATWVEGYDVVQILWCTIVVVDCQQPRV
jgi:hypothetical protein